MHISCKRHRFFRALAAAALTVTCALGQDAHVTVMTYNVWKSWSQVDEGFRKGIDSIKASSSDIVGLQEASPDLADRISGELGWFRADKGNGSPQIVSRFPIVESMAMERLVGARIRISEAPVREIVVFNCHLDYRFYGPYAAMKPGATADSVLQEEQRSERAAQMKSMLGFMKSRLDDADSLPVVLTGDFNSPSHLDWTAGAAHLHGNVGPVAWSPSVQLTGAGMADSFRTAHPDPAAEPGFTWSPIHKEGEKQDRIDFIYHKGAGVKVRGSRVFTTRVETTIGAWGAHDDVAKVKKNTWPSDHAAVVTEYALD
ncbi:endonuclease/exonuclease/phosphatase family protein [Luteolibacter sp. SL250]|uniref:endonuclease/exonuclease/phosphatase family protein n=1 Tax=Luteolibacter sp. SL250 TaxID=2995170 RepID=UPI002271FF3D|nr:endonuclease/exonuclease/phosphatase family protein [Luteolibacter sp. SL250]WAC20529.1 endonuclease/exonuclease/phosphatase family protein [Luteolibacter sp. SL250]